MSLSDIHYGADNTPGEGHDTDNVLFSAAMTKFSDLSHEVDFIITLGDFPSHLFGYSPKRAAYLKTVFHALYVANQSNKPLFYITGNNDSLRGNYQPFSWKGESVLSQANDWQGACAHCEGLLIDGTHLATDGYYSSYVLPHNKDIMLIALNSTQFASPPFFIPNYPDREKDATQQLEWLSKQLETHHAKQLLIAMHIPPGRDYKNKPLWHENDLKTFIELLNKTSNHYEQITLLTGHTHMDEIRKIHLYQGKNIYVYSTPSISRIHHNNPAMKRFDLDANLQLIDYTTYYTTTGDQWGKAHYSALSGEHRVFPQCHHERLTNCLDSLTNETHCNALKQGHFYGVKNSRIEGSSCKQTYPVN